MAKKRAAKRTADAYPDRRQKQPEGVVRRRKTRLSRDLIKSIAEAVKLGTPDIVIAKALGYDPKTYRNWRNRGEETGKGLEYELVLAIDQAINEFIQEGLREIERISKGGQIVKKITIRQVLDKDGVKRTLRSIELSKTPEDFKARAWMLERRAKEYFSRQLNIDNGRPKDGELPLGIIEEDGFVPVSEGKSESGAKEDLVQSG